MISIETSVCTWKESSERPLWGTETVWLNPDHIVSIEIANEKFRGLADAINPPDVDKFTKVHTTKTHYITTEPVDELARRLFDKGER
ncbi:hypothetical protein N9E34_03600 [Opitutales bacterium]|nr:hypothetical protein [Opitutales bacterium]